MKKLLTATVISALLLTCGVAQAQQLSAGMTEFGGQALINKMDTDGMEMTMTVLSGTLGKFVTDAASAGVQVMATRMEMDGGDPMMMLFLNGRLDYHLIAGGSLYPYAGAHAGLIMIDAEGMEESSLNYGVQGGVKIFVAENTAVNLEANYTKYQIMEVDMNNLQFLVGLSIFI